MWSAAHTAVVWMFFPRRIETAAAPSSVQLLPGRCSRQLRGSVSECSTTPARGLTDKTQTLCVHRSRRSLQTPSSWAEETRGRRSGGGGSGGHKRSASWGSAEHLREASTFTQLPTCRPYRAILPSQIIPLAPLCPQVAKLRHQLQKRSRHAPPSSGCELAQPPLQAGHAAGITQVTAPLCLCFL